MADFGTDVRLASDLAPVWGVASQFENLANWIARMFDTPEGGLFYAPDYGLDLKAYLNQAMTDADISALNGAAAAKICQHPAINAASVDCQRGSLLVPVQIETADGPFALVVNVKDLSVTQLRGGAPGGTTAAAAAPAPVVITVKGDKGDPGPQGPEGGGGSGGAGVTLDDVTTQGDATGAEVVLYEWAGVDFSALAASLTARMALNASSAGGIATFRLRVGGTSGAADGTVVLTLTRAAGGLTRISGSTSIATLSGLQFVKVTGQASAAGQDAQASEPVVSFR